MLQVQMEKENSHSGVDDPFKIFFSLFRCAVTSLNSSEKLWVPINAFAIALRRFFTLHVLDLRFRVCRYFLVSSLDGLGDIVPQFLRFTLALLV
jgi:hypothetical protein